MSHFEEKSGIVAVKTGWGSWWQTIEEVYIEVVCPQPITGKQVHCQIKNKKIDLAINGACLLKGELTQAIHADESVWTIEDKHIVNICLPKVLKTAKHCWPSLLIGQYAADTVTHDEMQKKLTLQRFQLENPGMDFSNAALTGNYQDGGPDFTS